MKEDKRLDLYSSIDPYIPEHILEYFEPVSGLRAVLHGRFLVYRDNHSVVVVGYPVRGEYAEDELSDLIRRLAEEEEVCLVTVIAPKLPRDWMFEDTKTDEYYRLRLPLKTLNKKLRYMVSRASRTVDVDVSQRITKEHRRLMEHFLGKVRVDEYMRYVCSRMENYVSRSRNVRIISAYDRSGNLLGFDVLDLSSSKYSFYMFNFTRRDECYVPGVSDLLLYNLITISQEHGKGYINMGLGIEEGVRRFKLKWGAERFLPYEYGVLRLRRKLDVEELFSRL